MKRAAFLFFLLLIHSPAVFAQVTKLDPLIQQLAKEKPIQGGGLAKAISVNEEGVFQVDCFVVVYNPAKAETIARQIEGLGGKVRTIAGDVMTAYLPLDSVEEVSSWPNVKYIEGGKPTLSKLDVARTVTKVDQVNNGTGLDARYDGSHVIVGIVDDTRPDFTHDDFTDPGGKTRVQFYWDKNASGSGVSEISGSSGLECTKTQIDASTCNATKGGDGSSHSTHVGGIAAGDDATFKGIAFGSDLIFVFNVETDADSGGNLSTTIVDDVKYVFAKASSLKQPAVVNLSLGTSIGAHDDTSAMEKALDNLVSNQPGRAIANAAGNENFNPNDTGAATYNGLHAAVDVTSGSDKAFDFAVRNGANLRSLGRKVIVDVWLNSTSTCTVELDGLNFAKDTLQINMGAVSAGSSGTATDNAGTTLDVNFTDSTNANNGKKHASATVTFSSSVTNASMEAFSFDLIFRGTCTGDAWIWPDRNSVVSFTKRFGGTNRGFGYTYQNGDSKKTITIPATASKLIAVASFMSKDSWTDTSGTKHNQTATSGNDFTNLGATGSAANDISLFSSLGPTADGRTKPDIAAPGEAIVSSMSANTTLASGRKVDSKHVKLEGTSMSSPHVAGIAALMFQKNPCLTSEQVKKLITDNGKSDSFTGSSLPNNTWGSGKADALAIMKNIVTAKGDACGLTGPSGEQQTPVTTTSGSAAGGGGCLKIGPGTRDLGLGTFLIWIFFVLLSLRPRAKSRGKQSSWII